MIRPPPISTRTDTRFPLPPLFRSLMWYNAYELQLLWFAGASAGADASAEWLNNPSNPLSYSAMGPLVASALDVFAHASAPRGKPAFGFTSVMVGGEVYPVEEDRKRVG